MRQKEEKGKIGNRRKGERGKRGGNIFPPPLKRGKGKREKGKREKREEEAKGERGKREEKEGSGKFTRNFSG